MVAVNHKLNLTYKSFAAKLSEQYGMDYFLNKYMGG